MCAHAVRVAIKKVQGVDNVDVSLNHGLAEVTFKPGNRATVEQVREIVRRNGFTPKGAEVRVAGRVARQDGRSVLAVTGTDVVYTLAEHPEAKGKLSELEQSAKDQPAVVSGYVPESQPNAEAPFTLQVREFTLSPR
ncbi:MAG TPA: heavy-metal-associated domain-containing protein [Pleomorphomonadaceae bacterium]|nr:heavy-metal-associated domain-containing protein [Pleomorphomonadaceae bacterium]